MVSCVEHTYFYILQNFLCSVKPGIAESVEAAFEAFQVKTEKSDDTFNPHRIFKLFDEKSARKLVVLQFPPELEFKQVKKSGKEIKQEEPIQPVSQE